jgi:hypothetical protein
MTPQPKRPVSVWISQIILGIYGSGTILIVIWGIYTGLSEGIPNPQLYLVTTVGILAFAAVYFGGVWGMAIRRPWGRWLGVAGLTILLIGAAITQTSRWAADKESSFVSFSFLFSVFAVLGLFVLAYILAAGEASDMFFDGNNQKPGSLHR